MKRLVFSMLMVANVALAQGALEVSLPPSLSTLVNKEVAREREAHPMAFAAVESTRARMLAIDARKRGRFAPVAPILRGVPDASWALVHALVRDGALATTAPTSAKVAWSVGLLEALGARRDPVVEPVLLQVLAEPSLQPEVARAAAEAVGRLGTTRAAAALVTSIQEASGPRLLALLSGAGACRRVVVAEQLARQLHMANGDDERRAAIKGLSVLADAWALSTPHGAPAKTEVPQIQGVAAQALVAGYVHSVGQLRQEARDAVLIVRAPQTAELLAQARNLAPVAVDELSRTFAQLPQR